jgi:transcriptional regulator of arginine metabolism
VAILWPRVYYYQVSTRSQRHAVILRLIRAERIPSQERLRERLADQGVRVAQSTLSRDLRTLGVAKGADREGHGHYMVPADVVDPTPTLSALLPTLFVGIDGVDHLLVLRTLTGGAQPIAVAIDHQTWEDVVGTIAGDDTVLIIARSAAGRDRLRRRLEALAGVPPPDAYL